MKMFYDESASFASRVWLFHRLSDYVNFELSVL